MTEQGTIIIGPLAEPPYNEIMATDDNPDNPSRRDLISTTIPTPPTNTTTSTFSPPSARRSRRWRECRSGSVCWWCWYCSADTVAEKPPNVFHAVRLLGLACHTLGIFLRCFGRKTTYAPLQHSILTNPLPLNNMVERFSSLWDN
jgi:hypothetical protein